MVRSMLDYLRWSCHAVFWDVPDRMCRCRQSRCLAPDSQGHLSRATCQRLTIWREHMRTLERKRTNRQLGGLHLDGQDA